MKKRAAVLLAFGLLQMAGDLLGLPLLRNVGKASAVAPAPRVFCAVDGYEAYATQFTLDWVDRAGVAIPGRSRRTRSSGFADPTTAGTCTARRSRTAPCCPSGSARRC